MILNFLLLGILSLIICYFGNNNSSGSSNNREDLEDENERLRRENLYLIRELMNMKMLCNNIFVLMLNFVMFISSSINCVK